MHACMHACIHTHTYLPTYLHTYLLTYIHTYIHTYILFAFCGRSKLVFAKRYGGTAGSQATFDIAATPSAGVPEGTFGALSHFCAKFLRIVRVETSHAHGVETTPREYPATTLSSSGALRGNKHKRACIFASSHAPSRLRNSSYPLSSKQLGSAHCGAIPRDVQHIPGKHRNTVHRRDSDQQSRLAS